MALLGLALVCLSGLAGALIAGPPRIDFAAAVESAARRFGPGAVPVVRAWQRLLGDAADLAESAKVRAVNDFFNRHIRFAEDPAIWGREDYWATPLETMGAGRGDCEDYAIAKLYSLRLLGVPENRLRMVYVRALVNDPAGAKIQAHMVLAYYPTPTAEPQIMDNLVGDVLPAGQREDLRPVFSFNALGVWSGAAGQAAGATTPSRWNDLLRRAGSEGFE